MRPATYAYLLATTLLAAPMVLAPITPAAAQIGIGIGLHITIAPPALPVYEPPPIPAPGYIFNPGYWAYGADGYYWVPGTWVLPPQPGLLWTPGYWGWNNGVYAFNAGYWGPHVGFYGGINYGFGYTGVGFFGGEWRGGVFAYNGAAYGGPGFFNGGGAHITNVYNQTIVNNTTVNRTSFNGPNGVQARPTAEQQQFAHEQHIPPTAEQQHHVQLAQANPQLRASANGGHPAIAATSRPGEFKGAGVVPAREAAANRAAEQGKTPEAGEHRPGAEQSRTPEAGQHRPGGEQARTPATVEHRPGAEQARTPAEAEHRPGMEQARTPGSRAAPCCSPA